ncbi:hypothetical protein [Methanoculleus sp. 10]|nr:hypothetical protein [Methanoculleus sp. 10]
MIVFVVRWKKEEHSVEIGLQPPDPAEMQARYLTDFAARHRALQPCATT